MLMFCANVSPAPFKKGDYRVTIKAKTLKMRGKIEHYFAALVAMYSCNYELDKIVPYI